MDTDTQKVERAQFKKISRRHFFRIGFYGIPALCLLDGFTLEPNWLRVKDITIASLDPVNKKILHFTDLHYKGDKDKLDSLIDKINSLKPDFVCFTGDIIEEKKFLKEALEGISKIKYPVYGIPGNHDYWSQINFTKVKKAFEKTGGRWLINESVTLPDNSITISGVTSISSPPPLKKGPGKHILLTHYPSYSDKLTSTYDLILAGHSHGGQVRIPFYGALITPNDTGKYEKGLYQTDAGPLYVNPGIGYWMIPVRFFCRPELTVISAYSKRC